ncbi:arylesterase [Candidatus Gracilibacteria bacterium]|nr:arylesterase [Candidatus Gracilibacteria bacterium]
MKIILIIIISLFTITACNNSQINTVESSTKAEKVILALGDSLTAGYGLPINESYPSQLESKLKENGYIYRVQNAGVSRDTSAGLLARMDWILEGELPELAILCIGANDAFQGKDTTEIENNIRTIIEKLRSKNIPILLAGMKTPMNLGGEYGRKYEAIFPSLAKEYNLSYMDFFLQGVALKAHLNQDDRIHPTKEGYTIIVENIYTHLKKNNLIRK